MSFEEKLRTGFYKLQMGTMHRSIMVPIQIKITTFWQDSLYNYNTFKNFFLNVE